MFCTKCGTKNVDGSQFCPKCGEKLPSTTEAASGAAAAPPAAHTQHQQPMMPLQTQKKSMLMNVVIGAGCVIALVVIIAIVASSGGSRTDYVETVRGFAPLEGFDISATYGQVVSRLISSPRWSERTEGDVAFVDLRGTVRDVGNRNLSIVLTFRLTSVEGRSDFYFIEPRLLEINGRLYTEFAAEEFAEDLFEAYDGGFSSVLDYYLSLGISEGIEEWFLRQH